GVPLPERSAWAEAQRTQSQFAMEGGEKVLWAVFPQRPVEFFQRGKHSVLSYHLQGQFAASQEGVMAGALDGIRIIELAQGMAGPYTGMLLAEQVADVI